MRSSAFCLFSVPAFHKAVKMYKRPRDSYLLSRKAWQWMAVIGGGTPILCLLIYWLHYRCQEKRAIDREKGILRLTAETLSKETIKTVLTDREVVKDLKNFGLTLLNAEETKKGLKELVKDRASDEETKIVSKTFITKHLWKDLWIQEEIIGIVQHLSNRVKSDPNIFPMPILSALGSVAVEAFRSNTFLCNLKIQLMNVSLEILRGPPQHAPIVQQHLQLMRQRKNLVEYYKQKISMTNKWEKQ